MSRTDYRNRAVRALQNLSVFENVYDHKPDNLSGSVLASVHNAGMSIIQETRSTYTIQYMFFVMVFVRRMVGGGTTAETAIDELTEQCMFALRDEFDDDFFSVERSVCGEPPPRDGASYRIEAFQFTVEHMIER